MGLGVVIIAIMLVSLSGYRGTMCALAPDVPVDTCPAIDSFPLPSHLVGGGKYNCEFTIQEGSILGSACGLIEDDGSPIFCYCCCEYSGQCGYKNKPAKGSLRPAGTPPPCDKLKTAGALLYAFILFILTTPWVHAVFRDMRRSGHDEGLTAQSRVV